MLLNWVKDYKIDYKPIKINTSILSWLQAY